MAASTHRSRQSRVLLGLLVAVLMLLPSVGALARTVRINLGEQRKSGIDFLMKERGLSRDAADRLARQYGVAQRVRRMAVREQPQVRPFQLKTEVAGVPAAAAWALSLGTLAVVTAAALVLDWRKIWIRL